MTETYIANLGIENLNDMQLKTLQAIVPGCSVTLIAPTGSGKTLAFLLPAFKLLRNKAAGVQILIIVPSRELAIQVGDVIKEMKTGYKVNICYGGHDFKTEVNNFREPASVIIGTPGRLADHIRRKSFDTASVHTLIIDEFDKSLELGFSTEIKQIIDSLSGLKTKVLTSATDSEQFGSYFPGSNFLKLLFEPGLISEALKLKAVRAAGNDKLDLLFRLLCSFAGETALVFCNHREAVERISKLLSYNGLPHGIYHGGMEQYNRELSLIRFRNGSHQILLTTDLASRGLDIPGIMHVVHYQLPAAEASWVHRNGRTARMFAEGTSWLVLAENESIPYFIKTIPETAELTEESFLPPFPVWETIYISAGKKQKISRGDIAGFLLKNTHLQTSDIGKIDITDHASFVAIKRAECVSVLKKIKGLPLKKKALQIELAYQL